ncbi:MAG: hypothetical protein L0Z53_26835 [Acidobacteriales bacterium]|nr:hypothetical protein [Terriglobales bacterium]
MTRWHLDSLERRASDAVLHPARDGRLPAASAHTLGLDADEYHAMCKVLNIEHQHSEESAQDDNQSPDAVAVIRSSHGQNSQST